MKKISSYIRLEVQFSKFNLSSFPLSTFTGFSEKSFFLKKKKEIWTKYGQWRYRFKFLKGIRLYWLFHVDFGEIRFLKWCDVINSNSCFLTILNGFSEGLLLFKLNFFLKIKKHFNENRYFMCQILARPTHPLASIWRKLWEIRYVSDP